MGRVLVQQPGTNTTKALSETLPKNVIIVDEGLKELRLHDGVTPGGKLIGQSTGVGVPIGTIIPFAGNAIPQGYLLCDGSAISRTDYASLFAVIGTIYGAGDGNSTFNLPNLIGRVPLGMQGVYIGQTSNGVLPNITGTFYIDVYGGGQPTGAFTRDSNYNVPNHQNWAAEGWRMVFDASRSNSMYGNGWFDGTRVVPSSVGMSYCIKY